jgi:hypothetical protein
MVAKPPKGIDHLEDRGVDGRITSMDIDLNEIRW